MSWNPHAALPQDIWGLLRGRNAGRNVTATGESGPSAASATATASAPAPSGRVANHGVKRTPDPTSVTFIVPATTARRRRGRLQLYITPPEGSANSFIIFHNNEEEVDLDDEEEMDEMKDVEYAEEEMNEMEHGGHRRRRRRHSRSNAATVILHTLPQSKQWW